MTSKTRMSVLKEIASHSCFMTSKRDKTRRSKEERMNPRSNSLCRATNLRSVRGNRGHVVIQAYRRLQYDTRVKEFEE